MFRRKRSGADFSEEIQAHVDLEAETLQAEGLGEEEARRLARIKFGSLRREQERFYMQGRLVWLDNWMRDLKHALRSLLASSGFTITAVATLALGVGANTAVFSVMNAVLLRSLPVADADRVMYLRTTGPPHGTGTVNTWETFSYPVYDALRNLGGTMAAVVAYVPFPGARWRCASGRSRKKPKATW